MPKRYVVRTLFLANFFTPAAAMAVQRRKPTSPQELVKAMKRAEIADQALERELNSFAEKGYALVAILHHPETADGKNDLLITTIFAHDNHDNSE